MKKKFLLLSLLFVTSIFYSQARLGYSYTEIFNEFKSKGIKKEKTDEGESFLFIDDEYVIIHYAFNNKGICNLTRIIPKNDETLKVLIEDYNKKYIVISDTEWKMYQNKMVSNIRLKYLDFKGKEYTYFEFQ